MEIEASKRKKERYVKEIYEFLLILQKFGRSVTEYLWKVGLLV